MSPTVSELLERLRELGATVQARGDRLRITAPHDLPPDLRAELVAAKPAVLAVLRATATPPMAPTAALRAAYRQVFALVVAEADGAVVDPATAQSLHQQIIRLTDDAGPLWADAVFAEELRRFRWETARCGLCGGLGHPQEHA